MQRRNIGSAQHAIARNVGTACGANPIAIVIPCHRIVGADGALTGYAGGLARKRSLLALERGVLAAASAAPGPGGRAATPLRGAVQGSASAF